MTTFRDKRTALRIAAVVVSALTVAACSAKGTSQSSANVSSGPVLGTAANNEALFPDITNWSQQGDVITGSEPTGSLGQVTMHGDLSNPNHVEVSVVLSSDLTQDEVNTAVANLHWVGQIGAGSEGSSWVGQEIAKANSEGAVQDVSDSTRFGKARLAFTSRSVVGYPTIVVDAYSS
jgi:hypothetical protein